MKLRKPCKHKFSARYDEKYTTTLEEVLKLKGDVNRVDDSMLKPYLKEKIYIYDICSRCGKINKRI